MVTPSPSVTPDGRYIVVRGRLWRRANPALGEDQRRALVDDLMRAHRAVRDAGHAEAIREARARRRGQARAWRTRPRVMG